MHSFFYNACILLYIVKMCPYIIFTHNNTEEFDILKIII